MEDDPSTIDAALDTALERVREAEERFLGETTGTRRSVDLAEDVEQRAEELEVLSTTARDRSEDPA